MFRRLISWLAFRWVLSVIMGAVAALLIFVFPDMGWLMRVVVLFVAGFVIERMLKPFRRRDA